MQNHSGNMIPEITKEEHDGLLNAKRVSLVSAATIYAVTSLTTVDVQIGAVEIKDGTSDSRAAVLSGATVNYLVTGFEPYSIYQNLSLVSGYNFYGFTTPGGNPTQTAFKLLRETLLTGEVLFGGGAPLFSHQWSSSSLASISYS